MEDTVVSKSNVNNFSKENYIIIFNKQLHYFLRYNQEIFHDNVLASMNSYAFWLKMEKQVCTKVHSFYCVHSHNHST